MTSTSEGVWLSANPRPTRVKLLVLTMSETVADSRSHDINTAGKRNHRVSGLVQLCWDTANSASLHKSLPVKNGELIHRRFPIVGRTPPVFHDVA